MKMKLEKAITICAANAGRSVFAEPIVQRIVDDITLDVKIYGRGIFADRYNQMFGADGEVAEKYVAPALKRYKRFKINFSQNIINMIEQGADPNEIAKAIFNEERADYIRQIKRYCDEHGLRYPKEWHQQLKPEEIDENTLIVSLDHRVRGWIDENYSEILIPQFVDVNVEDKLGGDYTYRKPIWEGIAHQLEEKVPEAVKRFLGAT